MSREILEQIVDVFNTGDTSHVEHLFAPGYLDHQKPEWLEADGPEEFRQIVTSARKSIEGLVVSIEGPVVADDRMVAGRLRWSGNEVERETIELIRIEDGLVVEHWGAEAWTRPRGG